MKQVAKVVLLVFFIISASCFQAQASVRIEITQGVDSARLISIIPFKWMGPGEAPAEIDGIIAADLRNSGKFNPIKVEDMPEKPTTVSAITAAAWNALDIDIIVVGQIQLGADNNYIVSYQLVDTSSTTATLLAQNQYTVTKQWLRYAAHTVSDEIFEKITGIKGAFRTRIAYIVKTSDNTLPFELRVADYDGYNQFIIHRSQKPLMSPAWSADAKKIAYVTFESGRSVLVSQTLSNGNVKKLAAFPRHNGAPAFSPDGSKLAFALSKSGSLHIYIMDLFSNEITQLTEGNSNNTEPSWFPDSKSIVYTSDQGGRPQVYKIEINNSSKPQRITWENSHNQNANVSPDGKFMVLINSYNGAQNIIKQDLETGVVKKLTNTLLDQTPSISPNGTMIIYSATQGLSSVLQLVSTDSRFKAQLPASDGQVQFPAWSPYF